MPLNFQEIEKFGIRRTDPRLSQLMTVIGKLHKEFGHEGKVVGNINVDYETFHK